MKKALKIFGIVIAAILVLMIVLPIAFKGKIKEVLVKEGNEMIDARFDFGKLSLSLFRNFPSVSASLHDFYVVGKDRFEADTLIRAGRLSIAFDLWSLFGDSGYDISRVEIDRTMLNAIVLEDGKANWDIMKSTGEEQADSTAAPSALRIKLKKLSITDLSLTYDDRQGKMYAAAADLDATLSGDLSASRSLIGLVAQASGINFRMGGVPYLRNADFYARMDVDADLEGNVYTLKKNVLRLNALELGLDGWLGIVPEGMEMDLKFVTPKINFKDILSLVPAIYAKDFADVQATGEVSLEGWAKGAMIGDALPGFDVNIKVSDATFRYPDLPKSVDKINIAAHIQNPGGTADQTLVDVNPFSFEMAGNPFSVKASVRTPVSDLAFDASAQGTIDLGLVKEVYPLDSMELNGLVKADASVAGRMSYIEKEQYENIKAEGSVTLSNMVLKSADNPDVNIKTSTLTFSPRYLDLSETSLVIGRNDLTLDCRVENYIAYAMKDATLRGTMNLRSNYLNANDLINGGEAETATADTTAMSVIEVPKNLDLAVNASLKEVIYDNMTIQNLAGNIAVKDGVANLKNLSMNTLGGAVKMSGTYSTAKGKDKPEFAADLAMTGLEFSQTFGTFVTIQKLAPIFQDLKGNFSGSMNLATQLDQTMSPVLQTMNGKGSLKTADLSLSEIGVVKTITQLTSMGDMLNRKVKDLTIDFTIAEGKINTKPFDIKLGDMAINLSGSTSLDQTIAYTGKVQLPAAAASATKGLLSSVNLKIGGTFTSPQVSLDTKDLVTQATQAVVNQALDEVGKKLGMNLADAQARKEQLVKSATDAGAKIMDAAQKQADALTDKAKDPLAKIAAKQAAAAVIAQAQKQVDAMVAKATLQGDSIVTAAAAE